jgi:hypothetical protein
LKLFAFGIVNLILFVLLLFIHTRYTECNDKDFKSYHIFLSIVIYIFSYCTIRSIWRLHNNYNLTAKLFL